MEFKEGVDYRFIIPEDDDTAVRIELTSGEFSGTIFKYNRVSFQEDKEKNDDNVYLVFDYDIFVPEESTELENNIKFKDHIGNILVKIMEKSMESSNFEIDSTLPLDADVEDDNL